MEKQYVYLPEIKQQSVFVSINPTQVLCYCVSTNDDTSYPFISFLLKLNTKTNMYDFLNINDTILEQFANKTIINSFNISGDYTEFIKLDDNISLTSHNNTQYIFALPTEIINGAFVKQSFVNPAIRQIIIQHQLFVLYTQKQDTTHSIPNIMYTKSPIVIKYNGCFGYAYYFRKKYSETHQQRVVMFMDNDNIYDDNKYEDVVLLRYREQFVVLV